MRAIEFILEGYKEAHAEFLNQSDPWTVKDTISKFKKLVNQNQIEGEYRNIDTWRKKGFVDFLNFVNDISQNPTKTSIKRKKVEGNKVTVYQDDNITAIMPLTKEASCNLGRHSNWCTSKPHVKQWEYHVGELNEVLIYCFAARGNNMWAITVPKIKPTLDNTTFWTQNNDDLDAYDFENETGTDPKLVINAALKDPNINNIVTHT
jgi:hypothetical protein